MRGDGRAPLGTGEPLNWLNRLVSSNCLNPAWQKPTSDVCRVRHSLACELLIEDVVEQISEDVRVPDQSFRLAMCFQL